MRTIRSNQSQNYLRIDEIKSRTYTKGEFPYPKSNSDGYNIAKRQWEKVRMNKKEYIKFRDVELPRIRKEIYDCYASNHAFGWGPLEGCCYMTEESYRLSGGRNVAAGASASIANTNIQTMSGFGNRPMPYNHSVGVVGNGPITNTLTNYNSSCPHEKKNPNKIKQFFKNDENDKWIAIVLAIVLVLSWIIYDYLNYLNS